MKPNELIRAIAITIVGIGLMVGLQPWLFYSETIFLGDVDLEDWFPQYQIGTWVVLAPTLMVSLIWLLATSTIKPKGGNVDVSTWRVLWFLLFLFPVLAICAALYFFNPSDAALIWLVVFYTVDVLCLYWLVTVTSTPGAYVYVPPLGLFVRRLLR
jgi:hypothetical protein